MKNQFHAETATLSLVNNHLSSIDFNRVSQQHHSPEHIAVRLPAVLQTSLELDEVIALFHKEIHKVINYDSFHYEHQEVQCEISTGSKSHHSCHYRLEVNSVWLGELALTRRTKFSDADTRLIEDLLCKLVYPLRNCLLYRQAQNAALQDKLTGLNNRMAFDASLKREIYLAHRQNIPMSLIILDIDNFKMVNDTYGHSSGDLALEMLANSIITSMRGSDMAFRYGGEEFSLILSDTDEQSALLAAERLRIAVSELSCEGDFGLSISLGIAQLIDGEQAKSLFDRADKALYQAKKSGKNLALTAPKL